MRTKEISRDEKLCFALDYIPVEKQYKKTKKHLNITNTLTAIMAGVSMFLGAFSLPTAISVAVLGSLVLLPSIYVFNSKMREVISTVNRSNVTFKQFRKMERTGELNQLIKEARQMQIAPACVGIEKLTESNYTSYNKTSNYNKISSLTKNNNGRNL